MKLSYAPYSLQFKHPFGIAHGTRTHTPAVYVKLEKKGTFGYGEAALPPYLPETQESVIAFLKKVAPVLENDDTLEELIKNVGAIEPGNNAAKAAIDIALYDLFGKLNNKPAYELLGIQKPAPKETSVTIGIGDSKLIPQKIKELAEFKILKVKLSGENDKAIIEAIRKETDKPLVVDVNQGWPDKHHALGKIKMLADKNVLYVEQPLKKDSLKDFAWLTKNSPMPILADESFQCFDDLERINECFSGINLKLMKCGGLHEAVRIIQQAKKKNLKINIGCMSESSCGISAAAQLMHYADWIDLDGPMLIRNDPFTGLSFSNGKLCLPDGYSGTGVALKEALSFVPA